MSTQNTWPYLQELSSLLKSLPSRPKGPGHGEEFVLIPGYAELVQAFNEADSTATCKHSSQQIVQAVKQMEPSNTKDINILSIGCGDCMREVIILSRLQETFPDLSVSFYGVDIDKESCALAEKKLAKCAHKPTIINADFMAVDVTALPKFDLVLMLHSYYYFEDIKALLKKAFSCLKPATGRLEILLRDERIEVPAVWMMAEVFKAERMVQPVHREILPVIIEMGLKYTSSGSTCEGYLHFDRCMKEGFDSEYGKRLMTFLCKGNLEDYPPEVWDACVAHIKSIVDEQHRCCLPELHISLPASQLLP